MEQKKIALVLSLVLFLAASLRLYKISDFPVLNHDEAAKGYNAYSLIKTGKSFRGLSWPWYFTDFSDKLPSVAILYQYVDIPSIAAFGLNVRATRFPAVVMGTATVFILYLLTAIIFKRPRLALLSSFLLATSPWHIFMSRFGQEPVSFPFFFLLGWWFLEKSLEDKSIYLFIGMMVLGISLYSYQIALILTPAFIFVFLSVHKSFLFTNGRKYLISILLFLLVISPIVYLYATRPTEMLAHYGEVSIGKLGNKIYMGFLLNYLTQLLFPLLVFFYLVPTIFFGLTGIPKIMKAALKNHSLIVIIMTFFLTLIPSALTHNYFLPQPSRSIGKTGLFEMIAAYAMLIIVRKIQPQKKKVLIAVISLSAFYFLNASVLLKIGFPHYFYSDYGFGYGFRDLVKYINSTENNYTKIVVTDKANQPFIYFLFYGKYPPEQFISQPVQRKYQEDSPYPYEIVESFGKYIFCDLQKCWKPNSEKTLYVARKGELPFLKEKFTVKDPYGGEFRIIEGL